MASGIVSLSAILLFAINYVCLVSVKGDCGGETDRVWSNSSLGNWSISLNESGYCYVNECTIRIKESNVLLNIINKTADWIAATDSTNLFTIPVTSNHNSYDTCSGEDDRDTRMFIFYAVVTFIICSSSSLNIALHLAVKKLRSIPGLLIIGICGTIIIAYLCVIITAVFQYLHRVNGNTTTCAVFKYTVILSIVLYIMLKATYLFHFAYLMYRSYTSCPYEEKNKKLLYIYGVVNVTGATVCSALLITIDQLRYRNGFETNNGYCTTFFFDAGTSGNNYRYFLSLCFILTAIGMVFLIIGLTLYYLTTKRCCTCSGMTGPNDARVSITLTSVTGLGALILVVLLLSGVDEDVSFMAANISVCVEQVILLIVFLTSTKARDKLKKCFQRKETVTRNKHTAHISMPERYTASYIAMR